MIADTVFSIVVETIFLVQGKASISYWLKPHISINLQVFSLVPIKILGAALNLVHQCLLHSLYCFEYKWFSQVCPSKYIWSANLRDYFPHHVAQGIELHRRLDYIETNWPYFLGFGLPLAVITSLPESQVLG